METILAFLVLLCTGGEFIKSYDYVLVGGNWFFGHDATLINPNIIRIRMLGFFFIVIIQWYSETPSDKEMRSFRPSRASNTELELGVWSMEHVQSHIATWSFARQHWAGKKNDIQFGAFHV